MTMVNRATHGAPPETVLTRPEVEVLDQLAGGRTTAAETQAKRTVGHYLVLIAKLGGYLARAEDPPPGNLVFWRGLTRPTDILLGFELTNRSCGQMKFHRTLTVNGATRHLAVILPHAHIMLHLQ
jgi:hypothetical protein